MSGSLKARIGVLVCFAAMFLTAEAVVAESDPERGRALFNAECKACHNVMEGAVPDAYGVVLPLYGIVGRAAAQTMGFFYSDALKKSGIVWSPQELSNYLENPAGYVPGIRMAYPGVSSEQDRHDIIAFLIESQGGYSSQSPENAESESTTLNNAPIEVAESALKSPAGGEPFGVTVTDLGGGLHVFRWWIYRTVFLVGDEEVLVVDPLNPAAAKALKTEIAKVTSKPVRHLVYSHNHHDHISGGVIFDSDNPTVYAHINTARELEDHPSETIPLPDITFDGDYQINLGDEKVLLKYFGKNHGDGLVVVEFENRNTAFLVDIVTPRRVAFRTMPDFWPDEWVRSLKEIEAENYQFVISAHGPHTEPALDHASVVQEFRLYLEELMEAVKTAMDSGMRDPNQLRKQIKLPQYKEWQFYEEWLPMNIERIWAFYHMGW